MGQKPPESEGATVMQPKPSKSQNGNNVRRRLFQNEENENIEPDLIDMLEESRQRAEEKWNFDFVNEVPLEGDWEWERVSSNPTD
ncbi:cyclin-dependent kinase inhibitor 1-like [Tribolium madens]|uniref:cyclin-dependent kinase inhibitor 1-like n=1 Tax=Tribolium madens TaxID=41895 RepID=UPI001CF71D44|nr:cyclin-dependent kinase inhibitor 1-like [Tribolium madens]